MIETNFKHTEIGLIPHDWEVKTLADVGTIRMCKRIMKYQTSDSGDIPFYKIGTFGKQADAYISKELYNEFRSKYNYPKKGDILLSAAGTIGRTVVFDGKPAYFQDSNIVWIENNEGLVVNSLLYYIYQRVNWVTDTGTIPRIYNGNVSAIRFPLPPTLAEQERIAGALSSIDTLIGALNEQIEKKRHIKQGTMQQLLTGKKRLAGFTGEWKICKIKDIVGSVKRGQGLQSKDYVKGNIPVVAGGKQYAGFHNVANHFGCTITVSGSGANAGYVAFHAIPIFATDCSVIDDNDDFVLAFVYYVLLNKQSEIYKLQSGGAQPHIYPKNIEDIMVSIPPTIAEQNAIAAVLSGMDTEIAALEQKRDKYIAIKSGMMQDLLTGKIRLV